MKKILSILLSMVLICTLAACQNTTPKETIEETKSLDYDFTLMTDEQLLRTIATREIFQKYAPDSDYSVDELMIASPELKELLNRDTPPGKSQIPSLRFDKGIPRQRHCSSGGMSGHH